MIDLTKTAIDEPTRVELDFSVIGKHPVGTTEREATQSEADEYAAAFSGSLPSEKVTATIVQLDGPGGGAAVVQFEGELMRIAALFGAFNAEAYMAVEDSAFARVATSTEEWFKERGSVATG